MGVNDKPQSPESGESPVSHELEKFTRWVRENQAGLRAFIRSLGVESDWVDDLAQEVLITAFRKRVVFDDAKDFGRWLRGIARNHVANERRKNSRRSRLMESAIADLLLETQEAPSFTQTTTFDQISDALQHCVGQLPKRSQLLLVRRYQGGENATVLAGVFEQSAEAIRQTLSRIRLAVKRCVEAKLHEASR